MNDVEFRKAFNLNYSEIYALKTVEILRAP